MSHAPKPALSHRAGYKCKGFFIVMRQSPLILNETYHPTTILLNMVVKTKILRYVTLIKAAMIIEWSRPLFYGMQ